MSDDDDSFRKELEELASQGVPDWRIREIAYQRGKRKARRELFGGYHERSLLILAFLGGFCLAALIEVIAAPPSSPFHETGTIMGAGYFGWIVTLLVLASVASMFGAFVDVYGGTFMPESRFLATFSMLCLAAAIVAIVYLMPLFLLPVFGKWSLSVLVLETVVLIVIFVVGRYR